MNFVFISANYPEQSWMFCRGLKQNGATVLAVVDTPYDWMSQDLRDNIDECYKVNDFNNYDEMVRALGYFTFKYGKIDWIESNNEAWLQLDARLRDDFNVKTGYSFAQIDEFQSKAAMKKYYHKAGIATARYALPKTVEEALDFAHEVGYPCVLKPDHGVGASFTYSLHNDEETIKYFNQSKDWQNIMEEFVVGDIFTLDGVADKDCKIRYLNSSEYVGNVMDSVNYQLSIGFHTTFTISDELRDVAQRTVSAFGIANRFFHMEYFRLTEDKEGLGKKGDVIGLEVNFRPPGGFAPEFMNFAGSLDVYKIWADILMKNETNYPQGDRASSGFLGRRNAIHYKYSVDEIVNEFKNEIIRVEYLPPAFAHAMGDCSIIFRFEKPERRDAFYKMGMAEAE